MNTYTNLSTVLRRRPQAVAHIKGIPEYHHISGTVRLYQTPSGVIVSAEIAGLPHSDAPCRSTVFGFHIHSGSDCTGDMSDPLSSAMSHYDPDACDHPYHAGDLPPLFGNGGCALTAFLTDRFLVGDVIGKVIIIHDRPDDFTTQPSGNSGKKIACGIICRYGRPC